MSRNRQCPDFEIRSTSMNKHRSRNSIEYKRVSIPLKQTKDSPYTPNPLPKTRSISTLNTKSTSKLRSCSPKLIKVTSNNSSMINIVCPELHANYSQRSINESYRQTNKDNHKVNNSYRVRNIDPAVYEERIKALAKLPIESVVSEYFKVFDEIIEKDSVFAKPLKMLKIVFEELEKIKRKSLESLEIMKRQLTDAHKKIAMLMEDRKFLDRRMHQISQENLELVKSLEDSEAAYVEIEEKLLKVTDFRVDKIEKSEQNWKALVLENNAYEDLMKKMKADLKSYKSKESKLLKLVVAMKNRGFPVEDVYNKEVYGGSELVDDSESDRIFTGNSPRREKPEIVPILPIDKIEAEVFTTSNCSSLANFSI